MTILLKILPEKGSMITISNWREKGRIVTIPYPSIAQSLFFTEHVGQRKCSDRRIPEIQENEVDLYLGRGLSRDGENKESWL